MKFRNLDSNHDWQFGKGRNNYKENSEAVKLNVKTRLLEWLNDCFFAMDSGIDYINRLGSKGQEELLEQDMRRIILQTEDVSGLNSFSFELIDRNFRASYNLSTIYNESFEDFLEGTI